MTTKMTLQRVYIQVIADEGDASYLYQDGLGFEDRRAAFERGDFGFVGVRLAADCDIRTFDNPGVDLSGRHSTFTISTPGLWSIESDSGEDYFRTVADDETDMLREDLQALGFTPADIDAQATPRADWEIVYS